MSKEVFVIGEEAVTIKHVVAVAQGGIELKLSENADFRNKLTLSREILEKKLHAGEIVYGVNTGYGDSCNTHIPANLRSKLPLQLTRYHQVGLGAEFDVNTTRAIQFVRIISLSQGYSAVRIELLEHMIKMFNLGVTARIPQEGSVGASGDLTPLSYYAATLLGEGEVYFEGKCYHSAEVYEKLNIQPIELMEKEALALMNGTAVMTAVACMVFDRSDYLTRIASRATAAACLGLKANVEHFEKAIFEAKPHWGTKQVAEWIRNCLAKADLPSTAERLQTQYSIRCAPHIIGVLVDALHSLKPLLEIEINSANDNPIIDINNENILHGGNFYGGHVAFIMDSLKVLVANVADLLDRQIALLVDTKFNHGLPANLTAAEGEQKLLSHGLKAVQISASAWTAEALKNCTPVSIFSRSTECHNQDKVSMGTIAARDAARVLELTNQVAAAAVLTSLQSLDIRLMNQEFSEENIGPQIMQLKQMIRDKVEIVTFDRPLEKDLRYILALIEECNQALVS